MSPADGEKPNDRTQVGKVAEEKMSTETEIKPAIARSIQLTEIVRLVVPNPREALELIDNDEGVSELDWVDVTDGGYLDVWGTLHGGEFRLHIATH